jgi:hypothetical protein
MSKQHEVATKVLRAIDASVDKCMNLGALTDILNVKRILVDRAAAYLVKRKLIEHSKRGCYRITEAGRALVATGVSKHKTGVSDSPTAQQTNGATGVRAAAWRAIRIKYVITLDEACSLIDTGTEANVRERIRLYFRSLVAAGVLATKRAPGGNGALQYVLVKNLGPLAPTTGRQGVFDPNANAFVAAEVAQ